MDYSQSVTLERTAKIHSYLKNLPPACTDYIDSIVTTTQVLTRLAYVIDFTKFCEFAEKELPHFAQKEIRLWNDEDWACLTAKDLHHYTDYLSYYFQDHIDPETNVLLQSIVQNHECGIMRKLASLRSFFDYMYKNERIPGNIASLVSLPKLHEKPILYLIGPEIEKLLEVVSDGTGLSDKQKVYQKLTVLRDKAILLLFLGTGMRISECVGINLRDLDFTLNAVLITRKGGNQSILYYPNEVAEALKAYIAIRKEIDVADDDKDALFLSLQRKRISQRAVQKMVKKYCAVAVPLKPKMSPHKLRSTYATRLYRETQDIYLVADSLGHTDVNTTKKHYASISDEHRRSAAANIHIPFPENSKKTEESE